MSLVTGGYGGSSGGTIVAGGMGGPSSSMTSQEIRSSVDMQDVLIKVTDGIYDLVIESSDFASAEGFETAIPVSLFTDSRAPAVQVQEAQSRRGWVGNILSADIERELGGLLWLLDQSRITENTLNLAKSYVEGSLQYLLDDNIARLVQVKVVQTSSRAIFIYTNITTIDNTVQRYVTLWRATDLTRTI